MRARRDPTCYPLHLHDLLLHTDWLAQTPERDVPDLESISDADRRLSHIVVICVVLGERPGAANPRECKRAHVIRYLSFG